MMIMDPDGYAGSRRTDRDKGRCNKPGWQLGDGQVEDCGGPGWSVVGGAWARAQWRHVHFPCTPEISALRTDTRGGDQT